MFTTRLGVYLPFSGEHFDLHSMRGTLPAFPTQGHLSVLLPHV